MKTFEDRAWMKTEPEKEVSRARVALRRARAAVCPCEETIQRNLLRLDEALWWAGRLTSDQENARCLK